MAADDKNKRPAKRQLIDLVAHPSAKDELREAGRGLGFEP
jgi:hypothetical protein